MIFLRAFTFQLLKNLDIYQNISILVRVLFVFVCVFVCKLSEEPGFEKIICKLCSFTLCKLHYFRETGEKNAAG